MHSRTALAAIVGALWLPGAAVGEDPTLPVSPETEELTATIDDFEELLESAAARAAEWSCTPSEAQACAPGAACRPGTPGGSIRLRFQNSTSGKYRRCGADGCDEHPMVHSAAGIYTTVFSPGSLLKMVNDGSRFVDVATVGLETTVVFGSCERR